MALPGVKTTLNDRFYTLSRTDIPNGPIVVAIGVRDTNDGTNDVSDYDPYKPRTEQDVITSFGEGSQLHRAYLELVSGGAARVVLVAMPKATIDSDYNTTTAGNVFDTAFAAAESAQPDIIVPWGRGSGPTDWEYPATPSDDKQFGFYADNNVTATSSWVKRVADKCQEISARSNPCFAVMGIKPYIGTGANATENIIPGNLASYLTLPALTDREGASFGDYGNYVVVVGTEVRPVGSNYETFGYSNGAAMFAGHASSVEPWLALTGKPVFHVNKIRYVPSRTQQEALVTKGIVPVNTDFRSAAYWVDALTFSKASSDYTRLSTLRITFSAVQTIRQIALQYVGQPASLHHRNALETAITTGLRGMTQSGAITSSDFTVTYVPRENKALINLVITPVFEMREIELNVSIQL